jgi:hypothetical protein
MLKNRTLHHKIIGLLPHSIQIKYWAWRYKSNWLAGARGLCGSAMILKGSTAVMLIKKELAKKDKSVYTKLEIVAELNGNFLDIALFDKSARDNLTRTVARTHISRSDLKFWLEQKDE